MKLKKRSRENFKKNPNFGHVSALNFRLSLEILKAKNFLRQYGAIGLLRKLYERFITNSSSKIMGLNDIELYKDVEVDEIKKQQLLLKPMNIYHVPNPTKRLNLVVDNLDENSYFCIAILALLANEWKWKIRLISRLTYPKKSIVHTILKSEDLLIPNIEFIYLPAGSSKIYLPVIDSEFFIVNTLSSLSSLEHNFDLNKCIYICNNLGKMQNEFEKNVCAFRLLKDKSILLIVPDSKTKENINFIDKEIFLNRVIQTNPYEIKSSWKNIYPIIKNHFKII